MMHAFDVLGDPVRRRILELLAAGERASGDVVVAIQREFGISQPAVSQHLKVLRDSGFAHVRVDGRRRLYAIDTTPLREVDVWLDRFRAYWEPKMEALATEIARGKRSGATPSSAARAISRTSDHADGVGGIESPPAGGTRRRRGQRISPGLGARSRPARHAS